MVHCQVKGCFGRDMLARTRECGEWEVWGRGGEGRGRKELKVCNKTLWINEKKSGEIGARRGVR